MAVELRGEEADAVRKIACSPGATWRSPSRAGESSRHQRCSPGPSDGVYLHLFDPPAQRVRLDPQLLADPLAGRAHRAGLALDIEHEPHRALTQLVRILPRC